MSCKALLNRIWAKGQSVNYIRHQKWLNLRCRHRFKMGGMKSDDEVHLAITAKQPRYDLTSKAVVTKITQETKTVKGFTLSVEHPEFSFTAGQWVDVFIPGVHEVGGFSICSSPIKLQEKREIDLAIKISHRAPALWFHTRCQIGTLVSVRAGGDFRFINPSSNRRENILLIAGGVGINPLASVMQYCADLCRHSDPAAPNKLLLLFSARDLDELLFKDIFLAISKEIPSFQCKFFLTRKKEKSDTFPIEYTRIQHHHLEQAINKLGKDNVTCYICGPLSMINDTKSILESLNIPESKLKFEKWW